MKRIWDWFFGPSCEHEWQEKATFQHSYDYKGQRILSGVTYVKECSKCQRIWAQRVP